MKTSEQIDKLAPALVKFQGEITNPAKGAENPHFKSRYASLPDILNHVRPLLAKHGLGVFQSTMNLDDRTGVVTLLVHYSGQWIMSDPCLLKDRRDNAQGAGSAITYGRRYGLCAALGIAGEDDDDANEASRDVQYGGRPREADSETRRESAKLLSLYSGRINDAVLTKDDKALDRLKMEIKSHASEMLHPHIQELRLQMQDAIQKVDGKGD